MAWGVAFQAAGGWFEKAWECLEKAPPWCAGIEWEGWVGSGGEAEDVFPGGFSSPGLMRRGTAVCRKCYPHAFKSEPPSPSGASHILSSRESRELPGG